MLDNETEGVEEDMVEADWMRFSEMVDSDSWALHLGRETLVT
jgi:hypothetical protein